MPEVLTVDKLIESFPDADTNTKVTVIELWADSYFMAKGKKPSSYDLHRLADWLLAAELKDKSRSKVQKKEYPILSKPQLERRFRELSMEIDLVDALHQKKNNHLPTRKKDAKNNEY